MKKVLILFSLFYVLVACDEHKNKVITGVERLNVPEKVFSRFYPYYEYAPTMMEYKDKHYTYWCARGDSGDEIRGVIKDKEGKQSDIFIAFQPTRIAGLFNEHGVCDPYVIVYRDVFYMYYGGLQLNNPTKTAIGVAYSGDGITYIASAYDLQNPIIEAKVPELDSYGAGQPSVIFHDGKFKIFYHDTTWTGEEYPANIEATSYSPKFENATFQHYNSGAGCDMSYYVSADRFICAKANIRDNLTIDIFTPELEYEERFLTSGFKWTEGFGIEHDEWGWMHGHANIMFAGGEYENPFSYDIFLSKIQLK